MREALRGARAPYPFEIDAWMVLPDHMHCIWTLPPGDTDYTLRWRLIKADFSKRLPKTERRSRALVARGERGISRKGDKWQRRFWEHTLRDERDYKSHMDYVHFNPVKHGHVDRVADWPHSSFHRSVAAGSFRAW